MADDLAWLDAEHEIYAKNKAAWEREERRLLGGDAVLEEDLVAFDGETTSSLDKRKKQASYLNFGLLHVAAVTGHIRMQGPTPGKGLSYGTLGDVRERDKIDQPTLAELLHYNVSGTGNDGQEMPSFFDAVDIRAQATGHRWLMVEAPTVNDLADIRVAAGRLAGGQPTQADVLEGFRPYLVEYSPLEIRNWHFRAGQLQFAVLRVPTTEPAVKDGKFEAGASTLGFYLLVRRGYQKLGARFAGGGWWKFGPDKVELDKGAWDRTKGQIPMWAHYGTKSRGAPGWPAMSSSGTMELNQIAVALMNAISARDFDAWDAAASRLYFLGATPGVMEAVKTQVDARSMMIGVPPVEPEGGTGAERIVNVYDGSTGAVPAAVFSAILSSKLEEAREQSIRQITSTPESSGASKEAGHREARAPFLSQRAALRQESEQTFIYFAELRFGFDRPKGFSIYPRDFDLTPLVDEIDAMLATLRRSGLRSSTLEKKLVLQAADDRGFIADTAERTKIEGEIDDSIAQAQEQAAQARTLFGDIGRGNEVTA